MFEDIHKKKLFMIILVKIVFWQVILIEVLQKFAGEELERLSWRLWAISVALGAISWLIALGVKCVNIANLQKLCLM